MNIYKITYSAEFDCPYKYEYTGQCFDNIYHNDKDLVHRFTVKDKYVIGKTLFDALTTIENVRAVDLYKVEHIGPVHDGGEL